MSDYYWDSQIEYLRNTRWLYYNDDYLQFLVERVWKMIKPVHLIDYGCGYGYVGLKLLPLLPQGSTYTGIDRGAELIKEAKNIFAHTPYETHFIQGDIEQLTIARKYDIAICHALLLHMENPVAVLQNMLNSVIDSGKIICLEPHWISNMAGYYAEGIEQSQYIQLGVLQKLFEQDKARGGKDGNIGLRVPVLLSQLGVQNIECRLSDKVNFLNPNMNADAKATLYQALREEGLGQQPAGYDEVIAALVARGLTAEEAASQYEAELFFANAFSEQAALTYAPGMKITFGTVRI